MIAQQLFFVVNALFSVPRRSQDCNTLDRIRWSRCLSSGKPLDYETSWPQRYPAQVHCSRCGLCETSFVSYVKESCALLPATGMSRIESQEEQVHGRSRDTSTSERQFGVLQQPVQLVKGINIKDAQWTGVVTSIALAMLQSDRVDAVVCIAAEDTGDSAWASPVPILARTVDDVLRGRGVKPALAPSLKVLDAINDDPSIRRLLFCGVGCAVQAFRAIEETLNLSEVFILGTNCVDNSPTPAASTRFVKDGLGLKGNVNGYEFMQDFQVHAKTDNGYIRRPYFCLPGTIATPSIAESCLACFDYTNGLADLVIGYMGAPLDGNEQMDASCQTMSVRNEKGSTMVKTAVDMGGLQLLGDATGTGHYESFAASTTSADSIVQSMLGRKVPEKGLPVWLGKIFAFVLTNIGPKGLNFAKYSVDYHWLRNYLHVLDTWGESGVDKMLPRFAKDTVADYLRDHADIRMMRRQILDKRELNQSLTSDH